jgi:hypothetical protein
MVEGGIVVVDSDGNLSPTRTTAQVEGIRACEVDASCVAGTFDWHSLIPFYGCYDMATTPGTQVGSAISCVFDVAGVGLIAKSLKGASSGVLTVRAATTPTSRFASLVHASTHGIQPYRVLQKVRSH